jgi:threonine/homoserine/homoserine lactone efflux protein
MTTVLDPELIAFALVAAVVTVIPGADMALVARSVLTYGRRAGYVTSIGACTGLWLHALASALGISAILMTSAEVFSWVKLAGAVYLVILGLSSLRRALRRDGRLATSATTMAQGTRHAYVQGLLSNLLNPKVAVFYLTLLPQFVRPGDPVLARSLLLASIHVVIGLVWLTLYTYSLGSLASVLSRPRVRRGLEAVTGLVLLGLGARLAYERR